MSRRLSRHPTLSTVALLCRTVYSAEMKTNRRHVLQGIAAGAATAVAAPFVHAQGKPVLRYVGHSAVETPETLRRAEEDLGITIQYTPTTADGVFRSVVTNPNIADLVGADVFTFRHLMSLGRTKPIDSKRVVGFSNMTTVLSEGRVAGNPVADQGDAPFKNLYVEGPDSKSFRSSPTQWLGFVPSHHQADTLGIRPDLAGREISSWGDLFAPEFHGKTALVDLPSVGIIDAALAIESLGEFNYVDKGNMTKAEIDFTIDFLIERKRDGHIHDLWGTFGKSIDLMMSGNVVVQSMWWPAVLAVRQNGTPCRYQALNEGYRGWTQGYGISSAVSDQRVLDTLYAFLEWSLSGWKSATMMRVGFYPSVLTNAKTYMSDAEWGYWIRGEPASEDILGATGNIVARAGEIFDGGSYEDRVSKIAVWNSSMDEVRYLNRRWREIRAA